MKRDTLRHVINELRDDITNAKHEGAMIDAFFFGLITGIVICISTAVAIFATKL